MTLRVYQKTRKFILIIVFNTLVDCPFLTERWLGWIGLVGFNVGLELRIGLLPTVWDSSLRMARRHAITIWICPLTYKTQTQQLGVEFVPNIKTTPRRICHATKHYQKIQREGIQLFCNEMKTSCSFLNYCMIYIIVKTQIFPYL